MNGFTRRARFLLILGDIAALFLVTVFGFATHGEMGAGTRMLTTFIPLLFGWFMAAPVLGVYDGRNISNPRQLWRPFWAMVLGGPLAAWLRGYMLNQPIIPIFVVVISGVGALSMLAWRALVTLIVRRSSKGSKVAYG